MAHTHILVDFENVQPSAADIALVRDEALRLAIFRGPGQMKYSADVAEAWQPLGARVTFVHCAKAGRNAVDMHIAFHLGQLVAANQGNGAAERARFVIVSKDTDFDPLLMSIRAQGFDASRVSSIKAALGGGAEPRAAKSRAAKATSASASKPAARTSAAKKTVTKKTARKGPTAPADKRAQAAGRQESGKPAVALANAAAGSKPPLASARPAPGRKPTVAPARPTPASKPASALAGPASAGAARAKPAKAPASTDDAIAKILDSLRRMGERRPAKRAGLERHIESHLGRELAPEAIQRLMHQLERDGVLAFSDNKVTYDLPKAKK